MRLLTARLGENYMLTESDPISSGQDSDDIDARYSRCDLLLIPIGSGWLNLPSTENNRARAVLRHEYETAKRFCPVWVIAIHDPSIVKTLGFQFIRPYDIAPLTDATVYGLSDQLYDLYARRVRIDELVGKARELIEKADFWSALSAVEHALALDPADKTALDLQKRLAKAGHFRNVTLGGGALVARERKQDAHFTVFSPPVIIPGTWQRVLSYIHVPEVLNLVEEDVRKRAAIQNQAKYSRASVASTPPIMRGAKVLMVPFLDQCIFKPLTAEVTWVRDWECVEFCCHLEPNVTPRVGSLAGRVSFFLGPLLIGEVAFTVAFSDQDTRAAAASSERFTAHPYNAVFVSYSHEDSRIVLHLERAYAVLGLEYLYDVKILRSGEKWHAALLAKIEQADVFQLLWSRAAKRSVNVEQEWRHALELYRPNFIRPVYWQRPLPAPPAELADFHFAYLRLEAGFLDWFGVLTSQVRHWAQ